jgi:hypothetical protein
MPADSRRNLYVDAEASPQGVGIGITLLIEEAQRVGSREAWLVCHQNAQLDAHSQIGEILGKQRIDALRKHQAVPLEGGAQLIAYTERHLPAVGNGSPVVVVHTNAKLLDKVDSLLQVPSLIVVPWNSEADTRAWREKRKPEIVGPPVGGSR